MALGDYQDARRVNIVTLEEGAATALFTAITATTTATVIDCRGKNGIIINYTVTNISTGNWVVKLTGCATSAGTFSDIYSNRAGSEEAYATTITANQARQIVFGPGLPNYVEAVATRTASGTLDLTAQPIVL